VTSKPHALIRQRPADFLVEEIPAYEPSGQGDHAFVTIRKTGLSTMRAVELLAEALGVDPREAGYGGLKDRHAVTTQTVSLPFARDRDLEGAAAEVAIEGLEILGATRHGHKLKPGHLRGNRFHITLRDLAPAADRAIIERLEELQHEGVPNAFGPQRFGRDGSNPERALAWLRGRARPPRKRSLQRLLFSSVQSLLYNRVLARRVDAGTWNQVLAGDLAKKHDSGGLFQVPDDPAELADATERAAAGLISATGPMFGAKMRWPDGEVAEIEREVLAEAELERAHFAAFKRLGRGTRRALRLMLGEVGWSGGGDDGFLTVAFVLPKGGYATTVLSELCQLTDVAGSSSPFPSG
jgi:tRNA pseudouridine13 synthase